MNPGSNAMLAPIPRRQARPDTECFDSNRESRVECHKCEQGWTKDFKPQSTKPGPNAMSASMPQTQAGMDTGFLALSNKLRSKCYVDTNARKTWRNFWPQSTNQEPNTMLAPKPQTQAGLNIGHSASIHKSRAKCLIA
jgi:hypothetical protein